VSVTPSQRSAARLAALAWPTSFIAVVAVSFGIVFPLNDIANPAEIARRVLAGERLFRIGIAGYAVSALAIVVQTAALYVVLEPVNRLLALLATMFRLVWGFAWVVVTLNLFSALRLFKAGEAVIGRAAMSGMDTYYVGLLFWSLAAAVGGALWFKSGYVPRALAAFGVISAAWCAACTIVYYVFPGFADVVNLWWFDTALVIFEIALSGWLLSKGLRPRLI
jgi:hypothetical protein